MGVPALSPSSSAFNRVFCPSSCTACQTLDAACPQKDVLGSVDTGSEEGRTCSKAVQGEDRNGTVTESQCVPCVVRGAAYNSSPALCMSE